MRKGALLVAALLVAACRDEPKTITIAADENDGFTATLPDGTVVSNEDAYNAAIASQVGPLEEMQPLSLTVSTASKDDGVKGITFGKFHIGIQVDSAYLAGCVNHGFLHLKVMVQNDSMPANLVELHLLGWFEKGKPCVAIMNTGFIGYGWCYKFCVTNPKTGLKVGIKNGLIAAGVAGAAATVIAVVVAPVASVALAM
jgi:hypothetical protein